jgi:hypothetical protein
VTITVDKGECTLPCVNGGHCVHPDGEQPTCLCPQSFCGSLCEKEVAQVKTYVPDMSKDQCGTGWNQYIVPEAPFGVPFANCCAIHDTCYTKCGTPRSQCDGEFGSCLRGLCKSSELDLLDNMHCPLWTTIAARFSLITWAAIRAVCGPGFGEAVLRVAACYSAASAYEVTVRAVAGEAYNDAQEEFCECSGGA